MAFADFSPDNAKAMHRALTTSVFKDEILFDHVSKCRRHSSFADLKKFFFDGRYIVSASKGLYHYACVCEGKLFTWGYRNESGEVGRRKYIEEPEVISFPDKARVQSCSCGSRSTFALLEDGSLYACGMNKLGELGLGEDEMERRNVFELQRVHIQDDKGDELKVCMISARAYNAAAVTNCGKLFVWGDNSMHQVDFTDRNIVSKPKWIPFSDNRTVRFVFTWVKHVLYVTGE